VPNTPFGGCAGSATALRYAVRTEEEGETGCRTRRRSSAGTRWPSASLRAPLGCWRSRANAEAERLADRVTFHLQDAADPELSGRYDLAIAIECIHDMSRPVEALRAMRSLVGEDGAVLVVDERVGETFAAPGDEGLFSASGLRLFCNSVQGTIFSLKSLPSSRAMTARWHHRLSSCATRRRVAPPPDDRLCQGEGDQHCEQG
jgi:hypothetical protein